MRLVPSGIAKYAALSELSAVVTPRFGRNHPPFAEWTGKRKARPVAGSGKGSHSGLREIVYPPWLVVRQTCRRKRRVSRLFRTEFPVPACRRMDGTVENPSPNAGGSGRCALARAELPAPSIAGWQGGGKSRICRRKRRATRSGSRGTARFSPNGRESARLGLSQEAREAQNGQRRLLADGQGDKTPGQTREAAGDALGLRGTARFSPKDGKHEARPVAGSGKPPTPACVKSSIPHGSKANSPRSDRRRPLVRAEFPRCLLYGGVARSPGHVTKSGFSSCLLPDGRAAETLLQMQEAAGDAPRSERNCQVCAAQRTSRSSYTAVWAKSSVSPNGRESARIGPPQEAQGITPRSARSFLCLPTAGWAGIGA